MKLKCKKCGNENLSFVSVTVQDGKKDLLCTAIGWINIIIFIIGFLIIFTGIAANPEYTKTFEDLIRFVTISAIVMFLVIPLSVAFLCFSFKKLMPYATHDEIVYICPCCGNYDSIEELELPEEEPISTDTQTDKENKSDPFW